MPQQTPNADLWLHTGNLTVPHPTGLHPASILKLNGDNAIKGPSGYSTSCRDVQGALSGGPDDIEVHPSEKSLALKPCMVLLPNVDCHQKYELKFAKCNFQVARRVTAPSATNLSASTSAKEHPRTHDTEASSFPLKHCLHDFVVIMLAQDSHSQPCLHRWKWLCCPTLSIIQNNQPPASFADGRFVLQATQPGLYEFSASLQWTKIC